MMLIHLIQVHFTNILSFLDRLMESYAYHKVDILNKCYQTDMLYNGP